MYIYIYIMYNKYIYIYIYIYIHIYIYTYIYIYIYIHIYMHIPPLQYIPNTTNYQLIPPAVAFTLQSGLFSVGIDNRGIFFTVLGHRKTNQLWHSSERKMVNVFYLLIMFGLLELFLKHAIVHSSEREKWENGPCICEFQLFFTFLWSGWESLSSSVT